MTATDLLGRSGRAAIGFVRDTGALGLFGACALLRVPARPWRLTATVAQIELVGARSAVVVALSAVFTGLVLALQGYNVLVRFGSENLVGLKLADALRGVRVIVLPSDGKDGTNPLDLGELLRKFQVK